MRSKQRSNVLVLAAAMAALFLELSSGVGLQAQGTDGRHSNAAYLNQLWSGNRQVGQGPIRFRYAPMRYEDIGTVLPIGLMALDHVTPSDHMGFGPQDFSGATDRYEAFAVGDGSIVTLTRNRRGPGGTDDYLVIIEHSGTFYTWTGLINHLSPWILDAVGRDIPYGGWFHVRIPVQAGQVLGRFGNGHGIDFSVINTEVSRTDYVYPEHYDFEGWKVHVVDYFDYVDEPLRSALQVWNNRKVPPLGGKVDYDIDGTLQGNWFVEGTNWLAGVPGAPVPSATHLSLSPHHIDPPYFTVSLGDFDGQQRQFWAKGNWPHPATVSRVVS